ncbi:hypothetical protein GCM10010912_09190 [Paenibacillus albidus]|uniref:Aspartyl-phosphate phosphatase Spo0E family protein n=1 Tax=Paenibacillus albidus TaxID=2041023 RepID=A0A917C237_9BACL|nr:aspartyl-phosphate phosphatase Spo0E family protein [Paenibacillus albidus]GGF66338.1 hypothetical protein GCM10010912_09190 [Paenibacillus albidus]
MDSPVPTRIRIERARYKLHQMQMQYGSFNHPKVLRQSVALDELLNQYNLSYQQEQERHTGARLRTI